MIPLSKACSAPSESRPRLALTIWPVSLTVLRKRCALGWASWAAGLEVWASWAAGLEVSTHTCRRLTYCFDPQELRTACARLPVKTWLSDDGCRHVAGLPPTIIRTLIGESWPEGGHLAVEIHTRCSCSLKTALVPTRKHARWRAIMLGTPFRDSVVVNTWPYLGAALTSSHDDSSPCTQSEGQEAVDEMDNELTDGSAVRGPDPCNTHLHGGCGRDTRPDEPSVWQRPRTKH